MLIQNWAYLHQHVAQDLLALQDGRVEAIYSSPARSAPLVASGEYKVIEDLDRHPDWTLRVTNGPYTTAVNTEFAKAHPEIVVAWLRAAIRAGRWINAHPQAAASIFHRTTLYPEAAIARLLPGYDLIPDLSAQKLAGLRLAKDFLRERGYIRNDLDVTRWADASYLDEALASLSR